MTTPNPTPTLAQILVAQIADPAWNSRVTDSPEEDAQLAESVRRVGVQTPVKVQQIDADHYMLIFGTRRLRAAREAGLLSIPAMVSPPTPQLAGSTYAMTAMMDNATENMARKDLSPYEQARAFADLRGAGWKLDDVAARSGTSKSHISNLVTIYTKVDPLILTEWKKAAPAATTTFLRTLAGEEDRNKQIEMYKAKERLGEASVDDEADSIEADEESDESDEKDETGTPKEKKSYTVPKARADLLRKRIKATKAPALALAVLKYLIGEEESIPGIIDPPKEEATDATPPKKTKK